MSSRLALPQPWKPADATDNIRAIADGEFAIHITGHAKDQMLDRGLILGDVHLLRRGFVYDPPQNATRGMFKYRMDGVTPNSENRSVRVVVLPCIAPQRELKIITVMWRDEDR